MGQANPAAAVVVGTRRVPGLGTVLVGGQGRTLSVVTRERANHRACTGGCAAVCPPLYLAKGRHHPTALDGVKGLRAMPRDGRLQGTSHHLPL